MEVFIMSFCQNCGNQLTDDSKFCEKCGANQKNASITSDLGNQNDMPIKKMYNNKYFTNCIIHIIIYAIITLIVNSFFSSIKFEIEENIKSTDKNSSSYDEQMRFLSISSAIRFIFIAMMLAVIISYIVKFLQIKTNYIMVTKYGISGKACPTFGYGILSFDFKFEQIKKIQIGRGCIIIKLKSERKKYRCYIEDHKKIRNLINDKIS